MIRVCTPAIGKEELQNAVNAIKKGEISGTFGEYIDKFEKRFSRYCGAKFGVATTSGTSALHLALASLGVGAGDEVILPALTNIATAYSVIYCNATPVVIDSEIETWNMNTSLIEKYITKKTKVIMPVHIYGNPSDMDPIMKIAKKYNLFVVEDAAEAHGAEYNSCKDKKWKKVGSIGDIGCFSFYANKIVTTGEGGMLVTNNKKIYEKAKLLKNLAFSKKVRFRHEFLGFNYRMTNLQASIGLAQISRIDKIINKKRYIAKRYNDAFCCIKGLKMQASMNWARSVYWMYCLLIDEDFGISRDRLIDKLKRKGIETRMLFIPMNQQPVFKKMGLFKNTSCPIAGELSKMGLYLPSGTNLNNKEIDYVIKTILKK